ncbi:vitellogenin N domain, partial, partial [Paramuricea clavata]
MKCLLSQARTHIATITEHLKTGNIKPETAAEFTRLVSVLRHCTAKTLREVVKDITACTIRDVKLLLIDAMARVGTEAAGIVLKECITEGKMAKKLHRITFGVGWVRGLDTGFMKNVLAICQHQTVVADVKAHRGCWFSFGTLVNRLMVKMRRNPRMGQDMRLVIFRQQIVKTIKEVMKNAKDDEEKITYIKAVGNAGWITIDIFKIVCDIINNAKTLLHVKVQAIWALRHMARVEPVLVRQKLLPILANPLVDPEIRISCYKILMQNDPSLLTCQMIGGVIAREAAGRGPRSNQFVSFVASDLRTSINYDNIDIVKASRARLLLRVIPRALTFQIFSYSKAINIPIDA